MERVPGQPCSDGPGQPMVCQVLEITWRLNRQEPCLLGAYRLMGEMTSLPNNVTVIAVLSAVECHENI